MSATRLRGLIAEHVEDEFPVHLRGGRAEGHDLAALDAHAQACMLAFLGGRAGLGWHGCWSLQECHLALCEVIEAWAAAGVREPYLERARSITGLILRDRCAALARRKRRRKWWQVA